MIFPASALAFLLVQVCYAQDGTSGAAQGAKGKTAAIAGGAAIGGLVVICLLYVRELLP